MIPPAAKSAASDPERRSAAAVVNPFAGLPGHEAAERAVALLRGRGVEVEVLTTAGPGQAADLARRAAERHPVVCAVGGDGTACEVAAGLLGTGAVLGLLPVGSGNDFARTCGIADAAAGALAVAAGEIARLDVGRFDERPFFNSAGLFLSGQVSLAASRLWRRLGRWRYVLAAVAAVRRPRSGKAVWGLSGEAEPRQGPWLLAEIANGPTSGGGLRLAPEADPADGRLDFCLVRPLPRPQLLRLLALVAAGREVNHPAVGRPRAAAAFLELADATTLHLDGEPGPLAAGRHAIRLQPAALPVLRPPPPAAPPPAPGGAPGERR